MVNGVLHNYKGLFWDYDTISFSERNSQIFYIHITVAQLIIGGKYVYHLPNNSNRCNLPTEFWHLFVTYDPESAMNLSLYSVSVCF